MKQFNEETIIQYLKIIADSIKSGGSGGGSIPSISIQQLIDNTQSIIDKIQSKDEYKEYINPTHLGIVNAGETTFEHDVVLCNTTSDNITVQVIAQNDTNAVSIILNPGWNPVIVKSVVDATENTLIYGW